MRCLLLLFCLAACASPEAAPPKPAATPSAAFSTPSGEVAVKLEVAQTPDERSRGLMYRKELSEYAGMIFVFPREEDHAFWMKNTYVPLDMIFVDAARTIVGIAPDTEPLTETNVSVGKASKYVIEVVAGFAKKHGIVAGANVALRDVPLSVER